MMIMYLLWLQSYKHFPKVPNKSREKDWNLLFVRGSRKICEYHSAWCYEG